MPALNSAQAQGAPKISVSSVYTLNRYGFATINESVTFSNNGTSAVSVPAITFGFGNLSSDIVAQKLFGSQFAVSSQGGSYTVSGPSVQAGSTSTFKLSLLVNGAVSKGKNGTLEVLTLSTPSISPTVDSLSNKVVMPLSTSFRSAPLGLKANLTGSSNVYFSSASETAPAAAVTSVRAIRTSSVQDFNPLVVYYASRTISPASNGDPLVTDKVEFQNMGATPMASLYVNLLGPVGTKVTILSSTEPRLINPVTTVLSSGAIDLSAFAIGYPNNGVPSGYNFSVTLQYPLGSSYYSVSGGKVTVNIPDTPPIAAFVSSYAITMSLPKGAIASQSTPTSLTGVSPWQGGTTTFSYGLSIGWAIDAGVPAASIVFILLLIGLFAARTTQAETEEEGEEESSSEMASTMIGSFDEKTTLINSLWPEIEGQDPNEINKEYFDELRGRLDTFRNRALQRLNEVKQKSTSKKFFEVVNQIQVTEREVDRAAKDKLNLYQQYYLRQMRKEVYDRLLPQYTKRLDRALNQLSDELHVVQREAKLL
jgi:hypothetical protein